MTMATQTAFTITDAGATLIATGPGSFDVLGRGPSYAYIGGADVTWENGRIVTDGLTPSIVKLAALEALYAVVEPGTTADMRVFSTIGGV